MAKGDKIIATRNGYNLVKNDLNHGYWFYNPSGEGVGIGVDHGEAHRDATMVAEFNRLIDSENATWCNQEDRDYHPSYFYPTDIPGSDPVYFDFIIIRHKGIDWTFSAWGDGAHVNNVAASGLFANKLTSQNIAYHNDEIEKLIRAADGIIAVRDHKVIYKKEG